MPSNRDNAHTLPRSGGAEQDALSRRARRVIRFQRGETRYYKRRYNKRMRRAERAQDLKDIDNDD